MKPACLLLLSLFLVNACNGQSKEERQTFVAPAGKAKLVRTQGTSQYANIYCSLKDKHGNLWFGTIGEGVYRYDGKRFTQFTTSSGLCNNYVYSILEDSSGHIWFGTAYGVCKYDGKTFSSIPIVVTGASGLPSYTLPSGTFTRDLYGTPVMENIVWSMMQDKAGAIWFGSTSGVYCYNGTSFTRLLDDRAVANTNGVHLTMVAGMLQDRKGDIWFCSGMLPGGNEGICRYDGKSIVQFRPDGEGWVRKVIEDKNGILYFATRHRGVYRYDGLSFTNISEKGGIDNGGVTTILQDASGNIWIGTELGSGQLGEDGGVWRYDGKSFTRFSTKDGLIHNGVYSIVEDNSGQLWFGTRNIGLSQYDGRSFTSFSE